MDGIVKGSAIHGLGLQDTQEHAAGMWMAFTGLTPIQATAAIGIVLMLAAAAVWLLGRGVTERLPLDQTAAVCAVLGYAGFCHVHCDNMMLFPLLLALVVVGFRQRSAALFVTAALLAFICYAEPGFLIGAAQTSTFARWFIFLWPSVACALLLLASRAKSTSPANARFQI